MNELRLNSCTFILRLKAMKSKYFSIRKNNTSKYTSYEKTFGILRSTLSIYSNELKLNCYFLKTIQDLTTKQKSSYF